jgi:hypothetical protein
MISRFFIDRPVLANVLAIVIVLLGDPRLSELLSMPVFDAARTFWASAATTGVRRA